MVGDQLEEGAHRVQGVVNVVCGRDRLNKSNFLNDSKLCRNGMHETGVT